MVLLDKLKEEGLELEFKGHREPLLLSLIAHLGSPDPVTRMEAQQGIETVTKQSRDPAALFAFVKEVITTRNIGYILRTEFNSTQQIVGEPFAFKVIADRVLDMKDVGKIPLPRDPANAPLSILVNSPNFICPQSRDKVPSIKFGPNQESAHVDFTFTPMKKGKHTLSVDVRARLQLIGYLTDTFSVRPKKRKTQPKPQPSLG